LGSYKWFRKTQVIPEYVVFYKNVGFYLEGEVFSQEITSHSQNHSKPSFHNDMQLNGNIRPL